MLLANNLSFIRNETEVFKDLNISLSPKKIIHLKGRNGIGKTTRTRKQRPSTESKRFDFMLANS